MKQMVNKFFRLEVMAVSNFGTPKIKLKHQSWWLKVIKAKFLAVSGTILTRGWSWRHRSTKRLGCGMQTNYSKGLSKGSCTSLPFTRQNGIQHTNLSSGRARVTKRAEFGIYAQVKMSREFMDTQMKSYQWISISTRISLQPQALTTQSSFGIWERQLTHQSWFWQDINWQSAA